MNIKKKFTKRGKKIVHNIKSASTDNSNCSGATPLQTNTT